MTGEPIAELVRSLGLPPDFRSRIERVERPIAGWIARARATLGSPMVVGIAGAQGAGKSTLAAIVAALLEDRGLSTALLSLDDLYLTRAEREALARDIHPLLRTRGVPGTHDPALGREVIAELTRPGPPREVALPRFDKATDDRLPRNAWPVVDAPVDVVLFEGWCVGARPQDEAALEHPANALERDLDPDGRWRCYANAQLAGSYRALFGALDRLVFLQAPDFDHVLAWRRLQEHRLAERLTRDGGPGRAMSDEEVAAFVMHYERLTRWMLAETPARADALLRLGDDHQAAPPVFRT